MSEPIIKKMTRYNREYTLYLKIDEHNICTTISSADAYDMLIHAKFKEYTDELWNHVWEFESEEPPRTYTEAEMEAKQWKSFNWLHFKLLGYNSGRGISPAGHGGKNLYDQYLESLNTPKP